MVCIHIAINSIWTGNTDHLDVLDPLTLGLNCYRFSVCNIWSLWPEEKLGAVLDSSQTNCLCVGEPVSVYLRKDTHVQDFL